MRTISRSNSTVVVRVSCGNAGQGITRSNVPSAQTAPPATAWLSRRRDIERICEGADLVVPPELSPGAVFSRLRHQTFKGDFRSATDLFQVGAGWNQKLRRSAIVVGHRENV